MVRGDDRRIRRKNKWLRSARNISKNLIEGVAISCSDIDDRNEIRLFLNPVVRLSQDVEVTAHHNTEFGGVNRSISETVVNDARYRVEASLVFFECTLIRMIPANKQR